MYGYKCFYNGKTIEVYAGTMLEARNEAARQFKVPQKKQHMISVVLCEKKDGEQVKHAADF